MIPPEGGNQVRAIAGVEDVDLDPLTDHRQKHGEGLVEGHAGIMPGRARPSFTRQWPLFTRG